MPHNDDMVERCNQIFYLLSDSPAEEISETSHHRSHQQCISYPLSPEKACGGKFLHISGQSYKHFTLIIYESNDHRGFIGYATG